MQGPSKWVEICKNDFFFYFNWVWDMGAQNDRTGLASIFTIEVDLPRPLSIEKWSLLWLKMTENHQNFLFQGMKHGISNRMVTWWGSFLVFGQISELCYFLVEQGRQVEQCWEVKSPPFTNTVFCPREKKFVPGAPMSRIATICDQFFRPFRSKKFAKSNNYATIRTYDLNSARPTFQFARKHFRFVSVAIMLFIFIDSGMNIIFVKILRVLQLCDLFFVDILDFKSNRIE